MYLVCFSDAGVLNGRHSLTLNLGHFPGVTNWSLSFQSLSFNVQVVYPIVPGHEVVGRIIALGPLVNDKLSIGLRVGCGWVKHFIYFNRKEVIVWVVILVVKARLYCALRQQRNGSDILDILRTTGVYGMDGGYAEYMIANQESCALIPEELDGIY